MLKYYNFKIINSSENLIFIPVMGSIFGKTEKKDIAKLKNKFDLRNLSGFTNSNDPYHTPRAVPELPEVETVRSGLHLRTPAAGAAAGHRRRPGVAPA